MQSRAEGRIPEAERAPVPDLRKLTRHEAITVLERNNVGRLALSRGNRLQITPIHYVYHDGWLYGRTSRGARVDVAGPGWWPVAFEVDEVDGLFDWTSVVVHGGFYRLDPALGSQKEIYDMALTQVRKLIPEALTESDPVPFRSLLFRIAVQDIEGREARLSQVRE